MNDTQEDSKIPDKLHHSVVEHNAEQKWECDLGNGEWDHDWVEKHDDAGEVDGLPGNHWSWLECRVCGAIKEENL